MDKTLSKFGQARGESWTGHPRCIVLAIAPCCTVHGLMTCVSSGGQLLCRVLKIAEVPPDLRQDISSTGACDVIAEFLQFQVGRNMDIVLGALICLGDARTALLPHAQIPIACKLGGLEHTALLPHAQFLIAC